MDMFRLVRDVPAYPEFLAWCVSSQVHEQTAEHQVATLVVKVSGMTQSFTTHNRFVPGERLTLSLVDGPFRPLSGEWLFEPLGMKDSSVGVRADLRERHIIPHFLQPLPFTHPSRGNYGKDGAFQEEEAEMPWVGCIASVPDLYCFADMLRRGGELDGARVLSPAMVDRAATNHTGDAPNGMFGPLYHSLGWEQPPACLGLGLVLRGEGIYHHHYGTLASPGTFGSMGAGSTVFWVDPARQMTFVCLRAGVMPEGGSIECFQRLSDMALSAAI